MSTAPFVGYPAQVWGACWQALSWLAIQLTNVSANSSPAATLETPVTAVFRTLWNGLAALSAWQTGAALTIEAQNLSVVQNLPLNLDPTTQAYIQGRVGGCVTAATGISALPPSISLFNVATPLAAGKPVIADPLFLEWCMRFTGEAAPADTILPGAAQNAATAWLTAANAIAALQGDTSLLAYDTAARQYRCASMIATILGQTLSGTFAGTETSALVIWTDDQGDPVLDDEGNLQYLTGGGTVIASTWSTAVALPALLLDAGCLNAVPASLLSQQISIIRYVLLGEIISLSRLLLSFRSKNVSQPSTGVLRNTESLMDFAARTTGDFENWSNIAALNNIQPPYPNAVNQVVALQGKQLFTTGTPAGTSTQATYANNVLGVDYDFGALNGTQPQWIGDIPLITGYFNFARAIGRRILTPLGSLVYHSDYGCSIPAEIGAIQAADEAAKLTAYGKSAILGDPRTGSILSASTSIVPGFLANFQAMIAPIGPGSSPVNVSQVIGAVPV